MLLEGLDDDGQNTAGWGKAAEQTVPVGWGAKASGPPKFELSQGHQSSPMKDSRVIKLFIYNEKRCTFISQLIVLPS